MIRSSAVSTSLSRLSQSSFDAGQTKAQPEPVRLLLTLHDRTGECMDGTEGGTDRWTDGQMDTTHTDYSKAAQLDLKVKQSLSDATISSFLTSSLFISPLVVIYDCIQVPKSVLCPFLTRPLSSGRRGK